MKVDITPADNRSVWADIRRSGTGKCVQMVIRDASGYRGVPMFYPSVEEAMAALDQAKRGLTIPASHMKVGSGMAWVLIGCAVAGAFSALARLPLFAGVCFAVFLLAVC